METAHELACYVVGHYSQFMTEAERRAQRHLSVAMKATHGRSDPPAQSEARAHRALSNWVSNDPEVLELAARGYDGFVERTAARILNEHSDKVFLNRVLRQNSVQL